MCNKERAKLAIISVQKMIFITCFGDLAVNNKFGDMLPKALIVPEKH